MISSVAFEQRGDAMPATVLVGCQWGDEGKGKIVDLLAERTDWVARFSGGPNAGHTVRVGDETFVLHLIPSGILRPKVRCVIGHGVVIDLDYLVQEIEALERRGIRTKGRLFLSSAAHILLPYHRWLEGIEGQDVRVGTTKRGIGPAYQDKMGRMGLRLHDLADRNHLRERLDAELARVEAIHKAAGRPMPESRKQARERWSREYHAIGRALGPAITDTVSLLHEALKRGERVLCEGSQGTFLDIDLGTYPFVTSASTTAGGAATGLGLSPSQLTKSIGISKGYTTRVGNGPFPTEFPSRLGDRFRQRAGEFGATTGRPRRCGWLDMVLLRYAVRVNGLDEIHLTKLDVLNGFPKLRVAVAYRCGRRTLEAPPVDPVEWARCRPVYVDLPGWTEDISAVRRWDVLPAATRKYVRQVAAWSGTRIGMVSVGSSRDAVIRAPR
jgi:adenylosuccinate synthase